MSEYIKALKRLRKAQQAPSPSLDYEAATLPNAADTSSDKASPSGAFKDLYDSLRLVAPTDATRRFVIAGADPSAATGRVVNGLAGCIESLGLRILRAELCLVNGRPTLRRQREQSLASLSALGLEFAADLKPLDLSNSSAQAEVAEWLATASRVADATLIEGCALSESVDAALLARSCDGLIVVAQAGATNRATLASSAERARAAGCRVLGLVLIGSKHSLPNWVHRFLDRPHVSSPVVEE